MAARSAGVLMHRLNSGGLEVLLVHPGGPFWKKRDLGAWSIPKGEIATGEEPEAAARREFEEELGAAPKGELAPLGQVRQRGGKIVEAFALAGDFDTRAIRSQTFEMEWPPRSGRLATFPEVDRAQWFTLEEARRRILDSQAPLLDMLVRSLG